MLPENRCFEVGDAALADARQRLEAVAAVELNSREVRAFTGRKVRPRIGTRPYLVRALRFTDRSQGFTVYVRRDGSLRTLCGAMGSGPAPRENYALVVFLHQAPKHVYPTFGLTQ